MNKHLLVFILCSLAIGCGNTKVFMGSYDSVKITVSGHRAQMTAENFPYETRLSGEKAEKKLIGKPVSVLEDKADKDSCNSDNLKNKLHVTIVCSDESLIKELSNNFYESGFTFEKRFHKPSRESTVISEVTIYPKRKYTSDSDGDYHVVEFETRGELTGGTHRVLVKDPLTFLFWPMNLSDNTNEIKMFIIHSVYIKDGRCVSEDKTTIIPIDVNISILSKNISTIKKPIKAIFSVM